MTRRQIVTGGTVYHTIFAHWGRGTVLDYREKDNLGYRTARKVKVKWEGTGTEAWFRLQELRRTPK